MVVRRWQVTVLNSALLLVIACLGGSTAALLLSLLLPDDPPVPPRTAASATHQRDGDRRPPPRYDIIASRDLFRTSAAAPDAARHLRLVGTASHAPDRFAVIEDAERREQRLYRVGDTVAPQAADGRHAFTLAVIEPARVVLDRDGARYVLDRATSTPAADGVATADASAGGGDPAAIRQGRANEYLLDRRDVRRALADLDRAATQIRAVPNVIDGEAIGYRVFGIRTDSVFARLGLQNGDVVKRVNTVALTDPTRALAVLRELPRERRVTLEIARRERPRTLTYEVR
jgi:general secretion pathway protein C